MGPDTTNGPASSNSLPYLVIWWTGEGSGGRTLQLKPLAPSPTLQRRLQPALLPGAAACHPSPTQPPATITPHQDTVFVDPFFQMAQDHT
jgi:hypothetical protein